MAASIQNRQPTTSTFLDAQITWRLPMTSARGALIMTRLQFTL
jgi:hypothetical protein